MLGIKKIISIFFIAIIAMGCAAKKPNFYGLEKYAEPNLRKINFESLKHTCKDRQLVIYYSETENTEVILMKSKTDAYPYIIYYTKNLEIRKTYLWRYGTWVQIDQYRFIKELINNVFTDFKTVFEAREDWSQQELDIFFRGMVQTFVCPESL